MTENNYSTILDLLRFTCSYTTGVPQGPPSEASHLDDKLLPPKEQTLHPSYKLYRNIKFVCAVACNHRNIRMGVYQPSKLGTSHGVEK